MGISISSKPLSGHNIFNQSYTATNINILDFTTILVLTVTFKHTQSHKPKLQDLTLKSVLSTELAQNQALRLSLVTSKIICKSLYGELLE